MVPSTEVVINIEAGVHPDDLVRIYASSEQACVDSIAADSLVLVAGDLIIIGEVHELGDRLMQENEVAQVSIVSVQMLLIREPIDGLRGDAGLTWKAILFAVLMSRIQSVYAEDFLLSTCVHDRDPRSEVTKFFLVELRACCVEIPDVARPTEIHAEGVIDLMKIVVRLLLNLVATGPDPRNLSLLDEFECT